MSRDQPVGRACIKALLAEIEQRIHPLAIQQRDHVRSSIHRLSHEMGGYGLDLDEEAVYRLARATLAPVHIQTIWNLLNQAEEIACTIGRPEGYNYQQLTETTLPNFRQQLESVRSILSRLQAGTLRNDTPPDVKVTIKSDIAPHVLAVTLPLVLVCWEDSKQPTSAWQFLDAFDKPNIVRIESVGYIIGETADTIALAANVGLSGTEDAQACAVIQIPQRCIVRRVELGIIPNTPPA